jgi:hypothetical protein
MDPAELERLIDRELQRLPAPRAPRTLLPSVMRAVRATTSPPPARGFVTWPRLWQVTTAAALVVLVIGVTRLWPTAEGALAGALDPSATPALSRVTAIAQGVAQRIDHAASAGRVVWRVLVEPTAIFVLVMVAAMGIACAAFGTALGRVAFGGASQWR